MAKTYSLEEGIVEIIKIISMTGKPILILIAGGSCSGKSYLSEKLKTKIIQPISLIELDNYFKDIDDPNLPKNEQGRCLFDVPDSYFQYEFKLDINNLLAGQGIWLSDYDFKTNKRLNPHGDFIQPSAVILVEGLFVISMLNNIYPNVIKVYVDADENIRLERRIKRDTLLYGVSSDKVIETFKIKVLPNHIKFVEPQKECADIIVKT